MSKEANKRSYQEWSERRCRENPCDICGGDACETHHIARGQNRQAALMEPCAVLHLCNQCHKGVHDGGYTVAEQLAYLLLRRDSEFNVERYYKIIARRWPSLEDINHAHAAIWQGINARIGANQ